MKFLPQYYNSNFAFSKNQVENLNSSLYAVSFNLQYSGF